MARSVVWIEGVDFGETLFDSQKLSVIRGASRALEEMPGVALRHFERHEKIGPARVRRITAGGSQAGFVIEAERREAEGALEDLMRLLREQGEDPDWVEPVAQDPAADLGTRAPFAHLKFQGFVEPIEDGPSGDQDAVGLALERARAKARVAQLRDPGVRTSFAPLARDQ